MSAKLSEMKIDFEYYLYILSSLMLYREQRNYAD